ncbi:hypothetical protein [Glaciecola petra]|uniref:Rap1a immunity protein domain-containing protein n=1 Tax=Glaciecola petra TaxID=3075602 RepID=A0ABU2ZQI3_9ALTE|nr:hypothetical protein [Aestuariibacter sp. P117]MDT0594888.1 hypothetical protein [Aestuariibacter sp. P117]
MNYKKINIAFLLFGLLFCFSSNAFALGVKQFVEVCNSSQAGHQQFCNTYLGGALDAIAVLNDKAKKEKQAPIYCKHEKEIFNAPKIIAYVSSLKAKWHDKNAILPVIDYLSAVGGCDASKNK